MYKTIATKDGSVHVLMTAEEIAALETERIANAVIQQAEALKQSSQHALDKSDMVAIRCIKANVPFPAEWQAYVADLRLVVSGASSVLPVQPSYPIGT